MGVLKRKKTKWESVQDMVDHVSVREKAAWHSSTKNKMIFVWRMDINYIKNCLNKLKRNEYDFSEKMNKDWIDFFTKEINYRELLTKVN